MGGNLPVLLRKFDAQIKNQSTLLTFSTATELNNSHFGIERSGDGRQFEQIGEVKGAGTTTLPQEYTFTDASPLRGTNYYRLKQVDYDGQFAYSPVVSVQFGKSGNISLAPSPASDHVTIALEEQPQHDAPWQLFDATGRLALSGTWQAETASFELDVNSLPEGIYTFRLALGQEVLVKQFRKQ